MVTFALIDTETTDLTLHPSVDFRRQPRMVEFAAVLTDGEVITDEIQYMVNPMRRIAPEASKVSNISDDDVFDLPPMSLKRLEQTALFLAKADVIIAHNLSFDRQIMLTECKHLDRSLNDLCWPKIEVCSVEETQFAFGKPMKLIQLYELVFGEYKQKHRARDDLNLLHAICRKYGIYVAVQRLYT
jgi:DNA polymerase III epsilon subunit-like protein